MYCDAHDDKVDIFGFFFFLFVLFFFKVVVSAGSGIMGELFEIRTGLFLSSFFFFFLLDASFSILIFKLKCMCSNNSSFWCLDSQTSRH